MYQFNQRLIDICRSKKVTCINLELPHSSDAFYDDCHFNENGADLVANQLFQYLNRIEVQ